MFKNLLYIGNKLSAHGLNQTSIETLGVLLQKEGYSIHFSSSKKNQYFRLFDMCWTVVLQSKKTDCVLIDTYSTSSFWYAFFTSQLCRFFSIPYIPILHGGNLLNRLKKNPRLSKMIFDNSYKNVAPSNFLYNGFKEFGFQNLEFIPNTIEIDDYKFKKRGSFHPKLLWVRAFASIYNPKMAIDVLYSLQKKYPKATLCMVGPDKDGSLSEVKKYALQKGVAVSFIGKMSKAEWTSLSEEFDIFINTTHLDNTPISVIEAMGLGLAVVSTNVGGIPYLLESNKEAVLVNDNDVKAMTEGIEKSITNQQFAETITSNARIKAASFDWKMVKEKWFATLQ
jgi:glycosyltransferase involved in cell wall biosynthesis